MRAVLLIRAFFVGCLGASLVVVTAACLGARLPDHVLSRMQDGRDGLGGGQTYIRRSATAPVICWVDTYGMLGCWPDALTLMDGFPQGEFVQVRVGEDHLCGGRPGGEVECWGWGDCAHGECDSPTGPRISLRVARNATCTRFRDWTMECWGDPAPMDGP